MKKEVGCGPFLKSKKIILTESLLGKVSHHPIIRQDTNQKH